MRLRQLAALLVGLVALAASCAIAGRDGGHGGRRRDDKPKVPAHCSWPPHRKSACYGDYLQYYVRLGGRQGDLPRSLGGLGQACHSTCARAEYWEKRCKPPVGAPPPTLCALLSVAQCTLPACMRSWWCLQQALEP